MREKIKNWFQDEFLLHTGVMVAGMQLTNIFNLIYHLIVVRLLSYEDYGTLNALVVFSFYFCQFTSPFQPALARFLAIYFARGELGRVRFVIRRVSRNLGVVALIVLVIFILAARPLSRLQQIPNPNYLALTGLVVAASVIVAVPQAFLQGVQLFTPLAFLNAFSALIKLVTGVGLVVVGLGVFGGLSGFVASPVFIAAAGYVLMKRYFDRWQITEKTEERVSLLPIYGYYLPTWLVLISYTILTSADVTLVKKFFPPLQAGYYAVAQMVGKIILFLPGAVSLVVFPKAVFFQAQKAATRHLLKKGLIITAALCGAGTLICGSFPRLVLGLLTGKNNPESTGLVLWFSLAMSFYALLYLIVFYNLSVHQLSFIKYLVGLAILQTAAISVYHPSLQSVIGILAVCSLLGLIIMLLLIKSSPRALPIESEIS